MEKLDYKKAFKDLYLPSTKPMKITVPPMSFITVDGHGDPAGAEYQNAIQILYSLSFTIKMSKMSGAQPKGYFEYVVPPLESLWGCNNLQDNWQQNRDEWVWTALIRQPEFVTQEVFQWALTECGKKKPDVDTSRAKFTVFEEGPCAQIMHVGPYSDEQRSLTVLKEYLEANNLKPLLDATHRHHEIYLADPRKSAPEKLRTVLRLPVAET